MKKFFYLLLLALIGCSPGKSFNLYEENDYFNPLKKNSDKYYTQGAKLSYGDDDASYAIGQNIFTPRNKHTTELLPGDRPYAGYLYGEYTTHIRRRPDVQDSYSIQSGLVGPGAGGKTVQGGFHKLLGQRTPDGWGTQLHNEPILELLGERVWKHDIYTDANSQTRGQLLNSLAFDAGNASTAARLAATFRFGLIPESDFGGVVIRPRAGRITTSDGKKFSAYLFCGGESRAVLRNIFLDGNTWRSSEHVTKKPFVAELRTGFLIRYASWKLGYTLLFMSDEWKKQKSSQSFGSIDIGYTW